MAPVRQFILVLQWRKSTNPFRSKMRQLSLEINQSQLNHCLVQIIPVSTIFTFLPKTQPNNQKPSAIVQKNTDRIFKTNKKNIHLVTVSSYLSRGRAYSNDSKQKASSSLLILVLWAQSRQSAKLFLQSSELELPHPPWPQASVPPHSQVRGGEGSLACERGVGGVPVPTRGHTLWCSIYIGKYFVAMGTVSPVQYLTPLSELTALCEKRVLGRLALPCPNLHAKRQQDDQRWKSQRIKKNPQARLQIFLRFLKLRVWFSFWKSQIFGKSLESFGSQIFFLRFLKSIGWYGFFLYIHRRDPIDLKIYSLERNPRL